MGESETVNSMLDATSALTVDWHKLSPGYGQAKLFLIDTPTSVVTKIKWADNSAGETHFWHGMYKLGKNASVSYPERYAALSTNWEHTQLRILTLRPYMEHTYNARFAIAKMDLECGAAINIHSKEDRFVTPEGIALNDAYEALRQAGIQGYLSNFHPDLADQIPAQIGLNRVKDVEFMTRASFGT